MYYLWLIIWYKNETSKPIGQVDRTQIISYQIRINTHLYKVQSDISDTLISYDILFHIMLTNLEGVDYVAGH